MEMTPQQVRSAEFKTVRKGADPDEVKVFLNDIADELERAQNQSTAMEARARAAVARLQEVADADTGPAAPRVEVSADEAETISRTLRLAQRTADNTVSEARGEAARITAGANDEAATTLDSTREMSAQLLAEARAEARQVGESERASISSEVEALKARRDFLESDVEQLELFLAEQRSRLRDAATSLVDITERVPGGLGESRRPLLSASDDESIDTSNQGVDALAGVSAQADVAAPSEPSADDLLIVSEVAESELADEAWSSDESQGDVDSARTPPVAGDATDQPDTGESGDEFRFSFDDDRR